MFQSFFCVKCILPHFYTNSILYNSKDHVFFPYRLLDISQKSPDYRSFRFLSLFEKLLQHIHTSKHIGYVFLNLWQCVCGCVPWDSRRVGETVLFITCSMVQCQWWVLFCHEVSSQPERILLISRSHSHVTCSVCTTTHPETTIWVTQYEKEHKNIFSGQI